MEAPHRCQGLGKTLLQAASCQEGLIWVWVYFRNRGERKTAWGVGGAMHQGGEVRDDREKRCRQTHSLGEKDTGCGILPPPGQRACIWAGQLLKKGHIHFQTVPENSTYPQKNCRKDGELTFLNLLGTHKHFMPAISFTPHDSPMMQSLLSPL